MLPIGLLYSRKKAKQNGRQSFPQKFWYCFTYMLPRLHFVSVYGVRAVLKDLQCREQSENVEDTTEVLGGYSDSRKWSFPFFKASRKVSTPWGLELFINITSGKYAGLYASSTGY